MSGRRKALIVAADRYQDGGLRRLRAPAADARELGRVLGDREIGAFEVDTMVNEPSHVVNERIEDFFADQTLNDLLLLHFSCHGVKGDDGELYFAAPNTKLQRLDATSISAAFVNRQMNRSRSRRILLLLDCCYSGAFARGLLARSDTAVHLKERFDGRGRVVLTASNAMEYAFEGEEPTGTGLGTGRPSVFTSVLVRGLSSGEADLDHDGLVSVDELYEHLYERVKQVAPNQTPCKWTFDVQGDLVVAYSPLSARVVEEALSSQLLAAVGSRYPRIRQASVTELKRLVDGQSEEAAGAARRALERLRADDDPRVASAAAASLRPPAAPQSPARPPAEAAKAPRPPAEAIQAPVEAVVETRVLERRAPPARSGSGTARTVAGRRDVKAAKARTRLRARLRVALILAVLAGAAVTMVDAGAVLRAGSAVPALAGAEAVAARWDLTRSRLRATLRYRASDTVPRGRVIGTKPPAGASVRRGSDVVVLVSSGPARIAVPRIAELSRTEADRRLHAAGFAVAVVAVANNSLRDDVAITTDPAEGTRLPRGTKVTLKVSSNEGRPVRVSAGTSGNAGGGERLPNPVPPPTQGRGSTTTTTTTAGITTTTGVTVTTSGG
ncbi:MAG TPA: PASTA domain-containing protein [Actinomycetota bacterium]|jgi:hypothetical protein